MLKGEDVPNNEKLFSIFEPETQLFKRGKAGEPVQFGHLVLVVEDAAGFICHYKVLAKDEQEREIVVPEMRGLQNAWAGKSRVLPSIAGFILRRTKRSWRRSLRIRACRRPVAVRANGRTRQQRSSFGLRVSVIPASNPPSVRCSQEMA